MVNVGVNPLDHANCRLDVTSFVFLCLQINADIIPKFQVADACFLYSTLDLNSLKSNPTSGKHDIAFRTCKLQVLDSFHV
jgi:hypothetical protein